MPYDKPVVLIGDSAVSIEAARRGLVRVGIDNILGSLRGGFATWIAGGKAFETIPQIPVRQAAGRTVIDVRSPAEFRLGHIEGAIHIPAGEIALRAGELAGLGEVAIVCGSGYRSTIAASLLKREGLSQVVNLAGGMSAYRA